MATELEQFVEANKQRLGEVNASNPQLYSAISMALDYLNKKYFGGTTELKVDIPQPTPVTPAETTQTASVERLFTDEELKKHIMDNVWTELDFKEIKIELTTPIQKQNFLNLIKQLLGGRDTYISFGAIGDYFYTDKDMTIFNGNYKDFFDDSSYQYQKLYYNQIFENLLKPQQTAKLTSVWDSVYAFSSKDYGEPIDYNFLQKAIYSNRRSKDMKFEIARAFGEIKSISRATARNWDEVEKNFGKTTADTIYQYELNDEVFKIVEDKGFNFFEIATYTDVNVKEWISSWFLQFEEPLKFDDIKEKLLEWYRNQRNKPTAQTNTPTTPQPNEFKPIWRFKTEQEFIDEYGRNWKEDLRWNVQTNMDYLLGQPITNPMFDLNFSEKSFNTANDLGIDSGIQNKWTLRPNYFTKIKDQNEENKATLQTSTIPNAKFKIGDKVKITNKGQRYSSYKEMFKKMGFANKIENDEGSNGDVGTIFGVDVDTSGRIIYGVYVEVGATRKYQILITEQGIELFQPTPLSASKFEVGDWVRLVTDDSMVGLKKGDIGLVTKFDIDDDPYIEWQDKDLTNIYAFRKEAVELALKNPKPIFKIGDLVRWKEDVSNYNVKKGAYANVVGFGVFDGNILANVEWVDTKGNKLKVSGQSDGGYNEDFFELALSNEQVKQSNDFIKKIAPKTPSPEETILTTTSQKKDEEDFEDLADELENLDF